MQTLDKLKTITKKKELAVLLGVKASFLTHSLYVLKPENQYIQFTIPKKNGGERIISAPTDRLKSLQSCLSSLLLDCIDEINQSKKQIPTLSHGFVRERSIITNAMMHLNQKNVLNIDLENYFDGFNFGRVRGFFIKNKNFKLNSDIATVIAQIACFDNKLPQGSPCSPVITNLITHSLDIRLALLAKRHSCIYSRYADDITFSTRKSIFPVQIMKEENHIYIAGKKLRSEIRRAGFSINNKKTRIQYRDSRQDVTGLIVNEKPNVKKEYWRTRKAQCNRLFQSGTFFKIVDGEENEGNINELEGQLNFIDQIDLYNRLRPKPPNDHTYILAKHGHNTEKILNGREKTFGKFLYYRLFYGNTKPTILCEGKTDNVYLKVAIHQLASDYPKLANAKTKNDQYQLLTHFVNYSKRTRFLLELHGGTSYIKYYIGKFEKRYTFYKAPKPRNPVIIVLDNDSGFDGIFKMIKDLDSAIIYPAAIKKEDCRQADFIHVMHNLYIVLTPLIDGNASEIEDLFDVATKGKMISGKSFNPKKGFDNTREYGKEIFASKVIKAQKNTIKFDGLKPLLDRVVQVIDHYNAIK